MMYTLTLRQDTLCTEDGLSCTVYGIDAIDDRGAILFFPDISPEPSVVQRLMHRCHRERVELCHLPDVVQDTTLQQYL